MTIDVTVGAEALPNPNRSTRDELGGAVPSPIQDVIVVFGGWGRTAGGQPLLEEGDSGSTRLVPRLRGLTSDALHQVTVAAFEGSLQDELGVTRAFDFIRINFHPLGRLIVYGYSAGGLDALRLAREIWQSRRFYDVAGRNVLRELPAPAARAPGRVYGFVRVDLLITVDPAAGPASFGVGRGVAPSARRNVNFYQEYASTIGSRGYPSYAMEKSTTIVDNRNWTARYENRRFEAHSRIDEDTVEDSVKLVQGVLGAPVPVPAVPSGSGLG